MKELQDGLDNAKQELEKQQSERTRVACVSDAYRECLSLTLFCRSKLEQEINEKLVNVHNTLLQAGVDQKESEREARMKETLSNLQRIFPGNTTAYSDNIKLSAYSQVSAAGWLTYVSPHRESTRQLYPSSSGATSTQWSSMKRRLPLNASRYILLRNSIHISNDAHTTVHAHTTCWASNLHSAQQHPSEADQ